MAYAVVTLILQSMQVFITSFRQTRMILDEISKLAFSVMQQTGHRYIRTEHLFFALFHLPAEQQPVAIRKIPKAIVEREINIVRRPTCAAEVAGTLSASAKRLIFIAEQKASDSIPTAEDLLTILLEQSPTVQRIWGNMNARELTNMGSN